MTCPLKLVTYRYKFQANDVARKLSKFFVPRIVACQSCKGFHVIRHDVGAKHG